MNSSLPGEHRADNPQNLWAVAAAVHAAVTNDVDGSGDGGITTTVTDAAALKAYVESYLDGYTVSATSLSTAISEGPALTAGTLKELISQATAAGLDVDDFFEGGEIDIEAGLAAAARHDTDAGTPEMTVRDRLFAVLQQADDAGEWIFVRPDRTWSTFRVHDAARDTILVRGLAVTTPYIGWGGDRDVLRPDGSFKAGEDCVTVFWRGEAPVVHAILRRTEALGYVVEGGKNGTPFRLVPADDASSTEPFAMPTRGDLLSDRGQTGAVRYATSWVEKTHRPKSDSDYLSDEEASNLFSEGTAFFVFPESSPTETPAWSMQVSAKKKVVVTHYHDPSSSVARTIELKFSPSNVDGVRGGSLRRVLVTDYLWGDDRTAYATKTRAIGKVVLRSGGGTPEIMRQDAATGETTVIKHRNGPAGQLGVSNPVFGEWGPIIHPWFGEADDPSAVRRLRADDAWAEAESDVWAQDAPVVPPLQRSSSHR